MNTTQKYPKSTLQPLKMLVSRYSIQIKNKTMQNSIPEPLFMNVIPEKWI
jgi:hypothetical protein